MIGVDIGAGSLFDDNVAYHKSLIPRKVLKMPWNFKGTVWRCEVVTNKEMIEKLRSLGIKISTDRSIREWIELGLGPQPVQMAKGPGTQNEHDNKAFAEFYASHKCRKWKKIKPVWAAGIRRYALQLYKSPTLFMKDHKELQSSGEDVSFIMDVYRWIAAREKALNNIEDGKVFEVIILLDEHKNPSKTVVTDEQDEYTVNFQSLEPLLNEPGVKNVGVVTVVWPNELNNMEVKRGIAIIY